jgi:DNA-binding NarL/FixJ family response regulator
MSTDDIIRVVVVDDHPIVRDGLRALLESVGGFEVVAEAGDGERAVAITREHRPHVVIMDLQLGDMSGIDATRAITEAFPDVGVLVITMYEDDEAVFAALRAGALGYLVKGADQGEILRAINAVARRESLLGPTLAGRVLRNAGHRAGADTDKLVGLTPREHEVLAHIANGDNNNVIARQLGLSPKTVANHVSNIFTKLQVTDRAHAIVTARRAGIGQTNRWNREP